MMASRTLPILVLLFLGADWPQWRGPDRTEISKDTGLAKTWPQNGPPLLWTWDKAGIGYSGPAVVGDRLYCMGARDETEYVYAVDTKTGKEIWATEIGQRFKNGYGDGPRCTPTIVGDVLYAIGGQGKVVCLETASGKKRWSVDMKSDLGGRMMSGWGYSESPLVDGDILICTPGGPRGTLAALNRNTGAVIWRSKELTDPAAYSSAIVADAAGVRQYIQLTGEGVAGVAAKDGKLLWRYVQDAYRTAVVPTPIFHDGHVYATAGYGAGCDMLKLLPDGKGGVRYEKVYANKNMVNHHGGVILLDGKVYGYSDGKGWVCQDFMTGENKWEEKRRLGKGSVTYADGHLFCYAESDGTLALVEATPMGWTEKARFKIPRETSVRSPRGRIWTHPVVANGKLYLRDQDLLFCFDVSERAVERNSFRSSAASR
jgi:outer membrane protein assembly factor BamB